MSANISYNFKPNNNLPTHYTPTLRNHEKISYGSGVQHGPRPLHFINNMLHKVSKGSNSKSAKELRTRAKEGPNLLKIRC